MTQLVVEYQFSRCPSRSGLPPPENRHGWASCRSATMKRVTSAAICQISEKAAAIGWEVIDVPGAISAFVQYAAQHEIDPYITLGVLVEGIAHTVAEAVPNQKQVETMQGITRLLLERFVAKGLVR